MDLFSTLEHQDDDRPIKLGQANIEYVNSASILTEAKGFMKAYDYTLNPYSGCSFGCNYCYAAFFSRTSEDKDNWGNWVRVKENALQLLMKLRKKPLLNKTIYISSVTDPYQPVEKKLELTRSILVELLNYHKPRIVIQTRSPLVARDIDLFKQFDVIQVNMTITTDSEEVRKAFEPYCPSNKLRLKAITDVTDAGIPTCITMTPLLPINDAVEFANRMLETGVKKFVVQPFHPEKGKFIASTREIAFEQISRMGWNDEEYRSAVKIFKEKLPWVGEGQEGFAPI